MSIAPIAMPAPIAPEPTGITGVTGAERAAHGPDLAGTFSQALHEAHAAEHRATTAAEQFARGDTGMGIHEVVIASEKANIAIRYTTTLKNKALEAYRELMNTQV
jgi:flagellar hook-basal body complex protein FliE